MTILFGPDEGLEPLVIRPLDGCRWCGITKYEHMQRWSTDVGWHQWTPLDQANIKARMLARRAARQAAEPTKYHAATAWTADHTGESADPYCADCKTDVCHRWLRIQARLEQQRWGFPRGLQRHGKVAGSGWGGGEPPW